MQGIENDKRTGLNIKSNISRIKNNQDGKVLASNMVYLTILQVASYLFPLITMPYLARVIGPDGLGKIAFASAIILWIQTISDWGFNYTATREVAKQREDNKRVSEIFSTVLWARCLLALGGLLIIVALISFIPTFKENALIILLTYLLIPGHILYPDWFFQAVEKMKYISLFGVLIKFIFTICVFIFIRKPEDYILQPLIISLGYTLSGLISLYFVLYKWGYKIHRIPLSQVFNAIKLSSDVFINNLMPNLYNSFSVILLGIFGSPTETGLYDAGKKFTTLANSALSVIARVFFPFLSRKIDKHQLYARFSLSCAGLITIFLCSTAQWLIPIFFGTEFANSINVLRITAFAIFFVAMSEVYGTNFLIVNNQDRLMRNITLFASLVGFICAFPLIYFYKHIGAAFVFLVSSMTIGLLSFAYSKKIK